MAKPKNPVRAARQAGREQIKSARQDLRAAKVTARLDKKLRKVEDKVNKLYGSDSPKMQGKEASSVSGAPKSIGIKSAGYKLPETKSAPKSKSGSKSGSGSSSGSNQKQKQSKQTDIKLSEYAELQKQYDEKKKKESRTQADVAEQQRIAKIKAQTTFANAKEKAKREREYQEYLKRNGKLPDMYKQSSVDKLRKETDSKKEAERKDKLSKLMPSSYMKKKGGSVKKYQPGGATPGITMVQPGGKPKSQGPRPGKKIVTSKQVSSRIMDDMTYRNQNRLNNYGKALDKMEAARSKKKGGSIKRK